MLQGYKEEPLSLTPLITNMYQFILFPFRLEKYYCIKHKLQDFGTLGYSSWVASLGVPVQECLAQVVPDGSKMEPPQDTANPTRKAGGTSDCIFKKFSVRNEGEKW